MIAVSLTILIAGSVIYGHHDRKQENKKTRCLAPHAHYTVLLRSPPLPVMSETRRVGWFGRVRLTLFRLSMCHLLGGWLDTARWDSRPGPLIGCHRRCVARTGGLVRLPVAALRHRAGEDRLICLGAWCLMCCGQVTNPFPIWSGSGYVDGARGFIGGGGILTGSGKLNCLGGCLIG